MKTMGEYADEDYDDEEDMARFSRPSIAMVPLTPEMARAQADLHTEKTAHIAAQAEQIAAKDAEIGRLKVELALRPDSFWVFEAYQDEGAPAPRYWGGEERGYTWKIDESVRFLRREDVERYAKGRMLGGMGRPVQHKYAVAPQPKDQSHG